jgi:maltose-binding protein MalE
MPQPAKAALAVNYPRYVGLAASKQSKVSNWAWDFILYAASNPAGNGIYLDNTLRPPALRSLISQKANDVDLTVFVGQALTARSWYEIDAARIKGIFNAAIQDVLSGRVEPEKALRQAQDQVTQLMRAGQ